MLDNESRDPSYLQQVRPGNADHTGRIIPRGWLRALQLDLTNAQAGKEFKLSGDFLFLDRNTSGIVTVQLNDPTEYGVPMGQFDMLEGIPIDRVYLSWAAQPGLKANIWFGYQARLKATAGVSDISDRAGRLLGVVYGDQQPLRQTTIGNTGGVSLGANASALVTRDVGYAYGSAALANTLLGAGGTVGVFTAAANTTGAIVWSAEIASSSAAANSLGLIAKTGAVAPASIGDGDPLLTAVCLAGGLATARLERPVFVAGGKALWFFSTAAEATITVKSCKYNLL